MDKQLFLRGMLWSIASVVLISGTSCVNEEYDMSGDNLNLEVTPFQEGVVLPLGSTDVIKISEVLKDVEFEALQAGADGAYAINFSDAFDMSDELTSLKDIVKIEGGLDMSDNFSFTMNDTDVSDVKIPAMDYSFSHNLASSFEVPDFSFPDVSEKMEVAAGMDRFKPTAADLALDFGKFEHDTHLMSISESLHVPPQLINDTPVRLDGTFLKDHMNYSDEFSFTDTTHIYMSLPEGINSVEDIILHEGAAMKVSLELKKSFLIGGSIIPEIDVDLHNLFHLDASYNGDVAHLANDFILSEANGYKQTKIYGIASLALESGDWKKTADGIVLDKDITITAEGGLEFKDLMTTTRHIEEDRDIDICMSLEFIDLQVDDMKLTLDPVEISQEEEIAVNLNDIALPEEVSAVNSVVFAEGSGFDISLSAKNIEKLKDLKTEVEALVFSFPESIKVEGADADNRISFAVPDLSGEFSKHIEVSGIDMPAPSNGSIDFNEVVKMKAVAKASGVVHLSELPSAKADDLKIAVDVNSGFEVEDYEVVVAGYDYALDMEPEQLSVELPADLKDTKEITIVPEGNPAIKIDFQMPAAGIELAPSADKGVKVKFPEMIRFKTLPAEYNYSLADNSITIKNQLPSSISLPVDRLVLAPEVDPADGKVYAKGQTVVSGALTVKQGVMDKAEIEDFAASGASVSMNAHIPEMKPSSLGMDKFETSLRKEIEVMFIGSGILPAEVKSVGLVELKDTYLSLALDASSLPDLGSTKVAVDMSIALPDMIKVSDVQKDEDGNIILAGTLDSKGQLALPPIRIDAFDLTGVDLSNGKDVMCNIVLDGTITMTDAALDVSKWFGKELNVGFKSVIKEIQIDRLTGKVEYKVDPVTETVDLGDFADALSGEGFEAELDFYRANLALEVETNLGVAVNADMKLIPYYDGKADESKAVKTKLALEPATSVDQNNVTRYWIADRTDGCPEGYKFVQADLVGLLKSMPEKLEVRLEAGTDPSRECVLVPGADYKLKAAYRFALPLEFGEDFCVTFKHTMEDVPAIVGQLVSNGKIKFVGEAESTLPLGLDLSLNLLDSNRNVISLDSGCGSQKIKPCGLDGSSVKTDLDLMLGLASGVKNAEVSAIEIVFKATSKDAVGVPLTEDASIQLDLNLMLPEGMTIDLGDMNKE